LVAGGRIAFGAHSTDSLHDGAAVRLISRPEDIEILPPAELASNQIDAAVEQVDYLGDRFEYYVRAAGAVLVLSAPKRDRYQVGAKVRLSFDPSSVTIHPR
jgi:ABC-type Fe3+/spermidine/putrescine transport system ATPase subunit